MLIFWQPFLFHSPAASKLEIKELSSELEYVSFALAKWSPMATGNWNDLKSQIATSSWGGTRKRLSHRAWHFCDVGEKGVTAGFEYF